MRRARSAGAWRRALLLVVFTLSGASGLIYEVLWTRRLTHIFGSTTLAVSTVLAAFMGGLALGSVLLGAWADRNRERALRGYGMLELAVAVLGLAIPLLLRAVQAVYLALAPSLENVPMVFFLVQFVLVGAVLALPCALMGGTLPMLARWLVGREEEIGGRVGALYAANTLGAFVGTAAAAYGLLPHTGVREGELVAVGLNVIAGLAALVIAAKANIRPQVPGTATEDVSPVEPELPRRERERLVLWATCLSGFACMVDEVAWARLVSLVFGSSVYAFGLMLLLFLGGMSIGSAIFARLRAADPTRVLGVALVANTLASLLGIAAVPHLAAVFMRGFPAVRDSFALQQLLQIMETAPLLLPLSILFGIAFPAAVAAVSDVADMGRGVGRVTAWNTAGTVLGAFLGGFVLIPGIGLRATLTVGAVAAAAGGLLALRREGSAAWMRTGLVATGVALLAALLLPAWPKSDLTAGAGFYAALYGTTQGLEAAEGRSELLFYKDGIATTLSVDKQGDRRFYRSNGKTDASTDAGDMANQLLLGHLPMLLHPDPKDVFVLGMGTGVSAAAVARYPVKSIDIFDIESASQDATKFFTPENRGILSDPRVRFVVADGRNALLARRKTYDVIISDPSDVWVAGVGSLFTREFYEIARSRLKPGGVMVQWFHGHSLPPEQMKLIVATFRSVFPHTSFWRPNRGDVILLGTVEPTPWDFARLKQREASVPGVHDDLVQIGFWQPLAIFSAFVLDGDDLSRMLAGVEELHTDNRPVVEYLAPRATYDDTATVNDVGIQALQTKTFPRIANFDETRDLDARAKYLLGFGMASIGRIDPAIRLMEQSVAGEVTDPKFLVGLGNQYRAKGMNIKAMAAYARALALAPGDDEAARNLADLQRGQGDEAGAEATLRSALQRVPDNAALAITVGKLLLESGRGASAEALLAPALAKEPQNAALQVVAGRAMAAAGHGDRAKDVLRQAAALAPEDAQTQREVAAAMLELGDADGAATAYARACELEPGSVEAHAGLAQASFRRGDAAGAREARRRALELDPYNSAMLALPAN